MIYYLRKLKTYIKLYGLRRTLSKVAARTRFIIPKKRADNNIQAYISVSGCGQFAFSAICHYLSTHQPCLFLSAYDVDEKKAQSLVRQFGFSSRVNTYNALLDDEKLKLLYIASYHSQHAPQAIQALKKNIDVYIEKPICTSKIQLEALAEAHRNSTAQIWAGFNRPYSAALKETVKNIKNKNQPVTLNCFIFGHHIKEDHWYRNPEEGSRIMGNISHWVDLMIHILAARGPLPEFCTVNITHPLKQKITDDTFSLSITTSLGDLTTITLTTREEPFEGINESIELQCGNVMVKIDDFRFMDIWAGSKHSKYNYNPKDVGHEKAILQPFLSKTDIRDIKEVFCSTRLSLDIAEMEEMGLLNKTISLNKD